MIEHQYLSLIMFVMALRYFSILTLTSMRILYLHSTWFVDNRKAILVADALFTESRVNLQLLP